MHIDKINELNEKVKLKQQFLVELEKAKKEYNDEEELNKYFNRFSGKI